MLLIFVSVQESVTGKLSGETSEKAYECLLVWSHSFQHNLLIRLKHLHNVYCKLTSVLEHVFGGSMEINQKRHDHVEWFPICHTSPAATTGLTRPVQRAATDIGFLPFSD